MDAATTVILLMLAVTVFALLASKIGIPYPTMMVIGGLAICFVPTILAGKTIQSFEIPPSLIFTIFLPPLLYGAAWQISWKEFWASRRPIFLLAVGLVLFTTAGVAGLAMLIIPGFTWATAFVLGAIVSPPDALAVTVIAKKLHLPRKLVMMLEGESLVNDASALVALKFALEAANTGHFSLFQAAGQFVIVSAGGVLLGLAIGWTVCAIHKRLRDPLIEITVTFLTPYAAYLLGEEIHVSGVLATVAAGLYVSWQAPIIMKPEVRIEANAVWNFVQFIMNGFVFVFVGLLLPSVVGALASANFTTWELISYGTLLSIGIVFLRMAWVVPGTFLPWLLVKKVRRTEQRPSVRRALLVGWTGMRGVVSLAAALALPETLMNHGRAVLDDKGAAVAFPNRGLIIYLAFFVILVTLVAQSLTMPAVVKFLKVTSAEDEAAEEREARLYAARAALTFLRDLTEATDAFGNVGLELRSDYERRIKHLESGPIALPIELVGIDTSEMDVQRETISIERQAVIEMRANQKISIEIYQRLMTEIDAAEVRLPGRR
ncbi:MAG TPA: Na+/H+ antiporter [Phycisphaerae bacterium]|jgi:CPA1 family monovalent cation:H+ antiporter|nr:Na+/H+ antiporter [Phycisphaerae bacterium]